MKNFKRRLRIQIRVSHLSHKKTLRTINFVGGKNLLNKSYPHWLLFDDMIKLR